MAIYSVTVMVTTKKIYNIDATSEEEAEVLVKKELEECPEFLDDIYMCSETTMSTEVIDVQLKEHVN